MLFFSPIETPRGKFLPLGSFESGNGFLQDRGFTVVTAAWELWAET
jgi:hypothetical protein